MICELRGFKGWEMVRGPDGKLHRVKVASGEVLARVEIAAGVKPEAVSDLLAPAPVVLVIPPWQVVARAVPVVASAPAVHDVPAEASGPTGEPEAPRRRSARRIG